MEQKKSYWIWYYGDFEIYHARQLNLRRQEFGVDLPPFWRLSSPDANVLFKTEFENNEPGELILYVNGKGFVTLDGVRHLPQTNVKIEPGKHVVTVETFKTDGLPSIYVESDVCPSGKGWKCGYRNGEFVDVGWRECYDNKDSNPEVFPFGYKHIEPVCVEVLDNGTLFDFGTEIFGYLNITSSNANANLTVVYGESREESLDPENALIFEKISGALEYKLRQRAFRFVFIKNDTNCKLSASAEYEYLPLEQKGNFVCDNELFNKVYEVSAYTFHLNCREAFLDGIKRDRWIWSGDAYQSGKINAYLFADADIVKRTALGLIGKEPIVQHLNTIVDYSLLWIIGLYEYYMLYGDIDFLQKIYPITLKLFEYCENETDENGFIIGKKNDWTFIDWADIDKNGAVCAEQILLAAAYDSLAYIADSLGYDSDKFKQRSENLKANITSFFWNDEKGAFIDSFASGKNNVTRHANIFAVMYGIASPEQTKCIVKNVLKNDSIKKITTPYFKGYELDAFGKLGMFDEIENMISSYWGEMVSLGAKTVWEEFDTSVSGAEHYAMYGMKYGKSLCHAWGAGAIYIFGRYYLGVYPTLPGYETFNVEPKLGGLKHIKGKVPVNDGTVEVCIDGGYVTVRTDKSGGKLIIHGIEYELEPNKGLTVKL